MEAKVESALWKLGMAIFAVVLLLAGALFYIFYLRNQAEEPIRTSGIIEGREVNLAPKIAGKISEVCCDEGDYIREGQIAVKLENEELKAEVKQAAAGVERAEANIRLALSSVTYAKANMENAEAEIRSAQADMQKATVQMEDAERKRNRAGALYERQLISQEEFETASAGYDALVADCTSSQSKIAAAQSRRDAAAAQLKSAGNQLDLAAAELRQARASLAYSQARLADTTIASALSGVVVFKALEKGETAGAGQAILTIVDLTSLYARVDIDETMVGAVALNNEAKVATEGEPSRRFAGRVSEIGRYADFATQRDVTRGRQDIRTFRVKIAVDDATGFLKPGMTVEVEIPRR